MTIETNEKDVNRALRVARMVAKCDCQEKGGSIDNHFATIICDNHDRMVEEIAALREFVCSLQLDVSNEIKLENLLAKLNQKEEE